MNDETIVKIVLNNWSTTIARANVLFDNLSEEKLLTKVAPNRNTGLYILGHLIAVNDMLLPLLNLEKSMYPELKDSFLKNPDSAKIQSHKVADLRQNWTTVNSKLQTHFDNLTVNEWLQKHGSVSAEDFIKEPHRNRLNVVLSRTNHLNYHLGQLIFLKD
ncbi:DinB family protein [Algibacter sp. Ld11]|uniref:DinB family protein n=1 Tax=Algibacter sp. Ld11 TaxID=649150 RepID=UPI0038708F1E